MTTPGDELASSRAEIRTATIRNGSGWSFSTSYFVPGAR